MIVQNTDMTAFVNMRYIMAIKVDEDMKIRAILANGSECVLGAYDTTESCQLAMESISSHLITAEKVLFIPTLDEL